MELKAPENIVEVAGHRGPHPRRYHDLIHDRLRDALGGCRTVVDCRKALTTEPRQWAEEVATKGTELNRLVSLGR